MCTSDMPMVGWIVGGAIALLGAIIGVVAYFMNVSPGALWFISNNVLIDNIVASALIWAFRFFGLGLTIVGLICYAFE